MRRVKVLISVQSLMQEEWPVMTQGEMKDFAFEFEYENRQIVYLLHIIFRTGSTN